MHIEPLRDYLVLRLLPEPKKPSGLVTPVALQQRPSAHAEILAIGPEVWDCAIGQKVVVSRLQGYSVDLGTPVLLVREAAVLAHLEAA